MRHEVTVIVHRKNGTRRVYPGIAEVRDVTEQPATEPRTLLDIYDRKGYLRTLVVGPGDSQADRVEVRRASGGLLQAWDAPSTTPNDEANPVPTDSGFASSFGVVLGASHAE